MASSTIHVAEQSDHHSCCHNKHLRHIANCTGLGRPRLAPGLACLHAPTRACQAAADTSQRSRTSTLIPTVFTTQRVADVRPRDPADLFGRVAESQSGRLSAGQLVIPRAHSPDGPDALVHQLRRRQLFSRYQVQDQAAPVAHAFMDRDLDSHLHAKGVGMETPPSQPPA